MLGITSKTLLFPYWFALKIRHFLYDKGIIKGKSYPVPVICVGNITVGGTGKTPHTEMIIRLLGSRFNIAVLSRGYKRKSKGFRIAEPHNNFKDIGDEPLQIKQKFPQITVAVCKNRCEGIEKLLSLPLGSDRKENTPVKPNIIILDDGFQHRKVKPQHSIVLVNYNNPIYNDNLLPIGHLRDLPQQIKRADSVVITKSPVAEYIEGMLDQQATLANVQKEEPMWRNRLKLSNDQKLYFSVIEYIAPQPVFAGIGDIRYIYAKNAIYFTGIANDTEFRNNLLGKYRVADSIKFADHKNFTKADIKRINRWAEKNPTAVIFTTEKDSKRLLSADRLSNSVKSRLFYIPIQIAIVPKAKEYEFIESIAINCN